MELTIAKIERPRRSVPDAERKQGNMFLNKKASTFWIWAAQLFLAPFALIYFMGRLGLEAREEWDLRRKAKADTPSD